MLRTPREHVEFMQSPERWPFRVICPLEHATERGEGGLPKLAILALGHGPRVFLAEVSDFERGEAADRARFEARLKKFERIEFATYAELVAAGWRVN